HNLIYSLCGLDTPLHLIVANNKLELLQSLHDISPLDLNIKSSLTYTVLYTAIQHPVSNEMFFWLIDNGADINATNFVKMTPLHLAVDHKNINLIKILIAKGADTSLKDNYGSTPFQRALKTYDTNVILAFRSSPLLMR
ncbi:MAG: ankyrin repeat domain-containing protein, partial [Endozoicomonadaceae bacterium]|nr:ankyrin repeat domain-containing protein [Endozoicomonadaceae bacterium]